MLHFHNHNLIFIEVPKTATSSIIAGALSKSKDLKRNSLYKERCIVHQTLTHVPAKQVCQLLKLSDIKNQKLFAFYRNPVDVLRSKYFFYRSGRAKLQLDDPSFKAPLKQRLNVFLANILPLPLWALVIPYTTSSEYILNSSGEILVDILCDYSRVSDLVPDILVNKFNIYDSFSLPSVNTSANGKIPCSRLEALMLKLAVNIRLKRDLHVWDLLQNSGGFLTKGNF